MSKNNGNPWLCAYCGKEFEKESSLNIHVLWKHNERQYYKCEQCQQPFFSVDHLESHLRTSGPNHGGNKYFFLPLVLFNAETGKWGCSNCVAEFEKKADLEEHLDVHRPPPKSPAHAVEETQKRSDKETIKFVKEGAHRLKLVRETAKQKYYCKLCTAEPESEAALLGHIVEFHGQQFLINGEFYFCHVCQLKFYSLSEFHRHLRVEHMSTNEEEKDTCLLDEEGDSEIQLLRAVRKKPSQGLEAMIKKELSLEGALVEEHFEVGGEMCGMCGKQFVTLKELRIHERMIHPDILERKRKRKKRKSLEELRFKSIIEDLQNKLSRTEKLIRKTVKKCRDSGKKKEEWSCKITAKGIKICCKEVTSKKGVSGRNKIIGIKRKEQSSRNATGNPGKSIGGKSNVYECNMCGMWVGSVTILKRHVTREHGVKFVGSRKRQNKRGNCLEKEGTQEKAVDSLPIVLVGEDNEEVDVLGEWPSESSLTMGDGIHRRNTDEASGNGSFSEREDISSQHESALPIHHIKVEETDILDDPEPSVDILREHKSDVVEGKNDMPDVTSEEAQDEIELETNNELKIVSTTTDTSEVANAIEIIEIKNVRVVLKRLDSEALQAMGIKIPVTREPDVVTAQEEGEDDSQSDSDVDIETI